MWCLLFVVFSCMVSGVLCAPGVVCFVTHCTVFRRRGIKFTVSCPRLVCLVFMQDLESLVDRTDERRQLVSL